MLNPFLLAQAATPVAKTGGLEQYLPMILIFVIFYFLLIRPQQKKMKKHRSMVELLKAGDEVITSGGVYGTIKKVEEATITLTIADKVDIKINKSSIGVVSAPEAATK